MTRETLTYPLTWDLDCFFKENELSSVFKSVHQDVQTIKSHLEKNHPKDAILLYEKCSEMLQMLDSYVLCKIYEDTTNQVAQCFQGDVRTLSAEIEKIGIEIDDLLRNLSDSGFEMLLSDKELSSLSFVLTEKRERAKEMLGKEKESLITDLAIDGYHGHSQTFQILHSRIKFPFRKEVLSYSQIENKLSDPDSKVREEAFESFKNVFKEYEAHFAEILNHIAGFRLKVYKKRGWDSPIKEPLAYNRMQEETLNSMMSAIKKHSSPLVDFLKRKAELFGKKKLPWQDVDASISTLSEKIPYDAACEEIIKQFETFSKKKATFAKKALEERWVEAEDRKNKGAGGFCIGFAKENQSRIFMTYSGNQHNVATLAHELGHCYHNEIIFKHSYLNQDIRMNVAETASTMAEMIVLDAALLSATSDQQKLSLLEDKLTRSVSYLMNLPARFEFEKAFYEERKNGYVLADRLCEMMQNAQKSCYQDAIETYHPHFWASKLHFFFTDVPFYNFPYTFGYLFSLGIYSMLKKDMKSFETKYDALLLDTPLMSTEALAKKHLGVDLTQETFWENAVKEAVKDVTLFLDITKA